MNEYNNQKSGGYQSNGQQNQPGKDNYFGNNNGGYSRSGGYNNRGGNNGGGYNRNNFKQNDENFDEANVRLYKAYAGTGNREAPPHILARMKQIASDLEEFGYTLRVGGMDGPELAFESGAKTVELHLPWKPFNGRESKSYFNTKEIQCIAKMFHPTWDGLKPAIQAFLGKNVRQLLGRELKSPVRFVICWSEDGAETSAERTNKTGSLGHVISLAAAMKIPVFNLGKPDAESRLRHFLEIPNNDSKEQFTEF